MHKSRTIQLFHLSTITLTFEIFSHQKSVPKCIRGRTICLWHIICIRPINQYLIFHTTYFRTPLVTSRPNHLFVLYFQWFIFLDKNRPQPTIHNIVYACLCRVSLRESSLANIQLKFTMFVFNRVLIRL